jgi:hypothetical protein
MSRSSQTTPALIALIVASVIIWRGREKNRPGQLRYRFVGWIVFVSFWWAAIEIMAPTAVIKKDNLFI